MRDIERYIQLYFKDRTFSNLLSMQGNQTNIDYTRTEKMILVALSENKMNMGELAALFEIPNSTANFIVKKFKSKQLVITERSAEDRRIIEVSLTEKGKDVLDEILTNLDQRFSEMTSKMIGFLEKKVTPEEIRIFKKCVDIILIK